MFITEEIDMPRYRLLVLEKTTPPAEARTRRWYRYVIGNGITEINGRRAGTEKEIRKFANDCIRQLNRDITPSRRAHQFRPAYLHYAYETNL